MFSLVIPAYNEAKVIRDTVEDFLRAFDKHRLKYELIIVNNGSVDATGKILHSFKHRSVKVVDLKKNAGFGGGLIAGFKRAKGDPIGFNCADGQVNPEETLRLLFTLVDKDLSLIKGDRRTKYQSAMRRFLSYCYNAFVRTLFTLRVRDINGYPIIMKRKVYNALRLTQFNWTISVEILHQARKRGFRISEIPIKYGERKEGVSHVDLIAVVDMFINLVVYRLKNIFK